MTTEAQRIACAKEQGFKVVADGPAGYPFRLHSPNGIRSMGWQSESSAWSHGLPNYGDLNVIHEMEKTLTDEELANYFGHLSRHIGPEDRSIRASAAIFCATAARRREAYLKVKGLWK